MRDGVSAKERIKDLGYNDKQLAVDYYFEKSKQVRKHKKLIKQNVINTQRRDWN